MFCSGFGNFRGYGFTSSGTINHGWMFFAMGFRLLIFIGLIFVAFRIFKIYSTKNNPSIKIIDEKFAKGEINEEEYLKRKAVLLKKGLSH
jgi:putative membrane protein